MGYYINPPDMSKEDFLNRNGKAIQPHEVKDQYSTTTLPVCLVDNGAFTAAGIAYNPSEADVFLCNDGRPKKWFAVERELLKPYYQ